jgi:hypothetical protein
MVDVIWTEFLGQVGADFTAQAYTKICLLCVGWTRPVFIRFGLKLVPGEHMNERPRLCIMDWAAFSCYARLLGQIVLSEFGLCFILVTVFFSRKQGN